MADQLVHFFEGAFVQQQVDAFTRGKLALLMLPLHAVGTPAIFGVGMAAADFGEAVGGGHGNFKNTEFRIQKPERRGQAAGGSTKEPENRRTEEPKNYYSA